MKHPIDPRVDCVFKALLGAEENRNLLVHFLNAFLAQELIEPLVSVDILNPYNDKEFISDKFCVVDVKAGDGHGRLYQIEIQLTVYLHLPARILYNWTDLFSKQLKSGEAYKKLKPTYAIWLLAENLLHDDNHYVHHYKMRDEQGQELSPLGGIWLLELPKFKARKIESEAQRWLKFFTEGEQIDDTHLPEWMTTQEMQQAMSTLTRFSEKERQYDLYQARQEYLREQRTIQSELEEALQREANALAEKEAANQREKAATQREAAALAEIERLKALLDQKLH